MVKNKRGWVRIIEVFVSITLIASIALIIIGNNIQERNYSEEISSMELRILKQIRINETLRDEVMNAGVPTNWSDFESNGLIEVVEKINNEKFSILECEAKICSIDEQCNQDSNIRKNVYARSGVFSTNNVYNPRQLKLFCWEI
jgi:hypothetical protein